MANFTFSPRRRRNPFGNLSATIIFLGINVVAFLIFIVLISLNVPIDYIAIKPSNIFNGDYVWTFLTSMFMHGGFFHLFANMISLLFIGTFIERILGFRRYVYFYLFSGLFAGLFFVLMSLVFQSDFNTYAVGASGALFGLAGLMIVLTPNIPLYVMFIPIPVKAKYAIPGLLVILWLVSIAGNVPIGNTAHLGGLLAGLGYGLFLKKKYKRKTDLIKRRFS